jgi:hypothetical protein
MLPGLLNRGYTPSHHLMVEAACNILATMYRTVLQRCGQGH